MKGKTLAISLEIKYIILGVDHLLPLPPPHIFEMINVQQIC
jgi:hypothetical protein